MITQQDMKQKPLTQRFNSIDLYVFSLRDLSKKVKIVKIKEVALNGVVYDF